MLRKHSQTFVALLFLWDLFGVAGCWLAAYLARFQSGLVPVTKGIPDFSLYVYVLPLVVLLHAVTYHYGGLYSPRREGNLLQEVFDILKVNLVAFLILVTLLYMYQRQLYSGAVLLCFVSFSTASMALGRMGMRLVLRSLRKRGWNQRYALIVGAGRLGQRLALALRKNAWTGIQIVGFLDHRLERLGRSYHGVPVLGSLSELRETLERRPVDQVLVALSLREWPLIEETLAQLDDQVADVRLVADMSSFALLRSSVTELDGVPLLNLRESPMYGWNRFLKRALDLFVASTALVVTGPLIALVAAAIKLTSSGPVFYKQERVGLDGKRFRMLKFRTMPPEAETSSGPVWATEDDPRRTRLGAFLRRTSLDELPQFVNVLLGQMSVVGPRPERPFFIEQFRQHVPRYMLRHKIKAGITGWAQVNGWRGNTSIKKRIQYDLYYIQHWSVWLDLGIMALTVSRGLRNRNAY